jgi:flagellar biosynthesis chaperone FliJ
MGFLKHANNGIRKAANMIKSIEQSMDLMMRRNWSGTRGTVVCQVPDIQNFISVLLRFTQPQRSVSRATTEWPDTEQTFTL